MPAYIDVCKRGIHVRIWDVMHAMHGQKFIPIRNKAWYAVYRRILLGQEEGLFYFHKFERGQFTLVKFEWTVSEETFVRIGTDSTCDCAHRSSIWVECTWTHGNIGLPPSSS